MPLVSAIRLPPADAPPRQPLVSRSAAELSAARPSAAPTAVSLLRVVPFALKPAHWMRNRTKLTICAYNSPNPSVRITRNHTSCSLENLGPHHFMVSHAIDKDVSVLVNEAARVRESPLRCRLAVNPVREAVLAHRLRQRQTARLRHRPIACRTVHATSSKHSRKSAVAKGIFCSNLSKSFSGASSQCQYFCRIR